MSNYPPPTQFNPIFNDLEYYSSSSTLTISQADMRYLKLTGGTVIGLTSFSAGISTANIYNGGFTFSMPSASGQLALVSQIPSSANFVDTTTNQTINGIKTFGTNPIISAISNSGFNLSIPTLTAGDTILTLGLNQTITGIKTFSTAPIISTISNTGTLTLPTTTDTLIGRATTDILTNKSLVDASCFWVNSVDNTKKLAWSLGTQTASTTLTLISNQTTSQSLNVPNITTTDTILTSGLTQTITATKNFTGGSGIVTSGVYPRTSASNQQSSTFTTPAIQIGGNTNDGIYSSATDIIDIGMQGTNYISLQPQGIYRFVGGTVDPAIVFNQRIQAYNGANGASSPGIQIDNQNSGFYRVNQGTIGIGISGVATARWSSAGLNLFGVAGTAAAPALVFANDTTSGLYRPAANQVGMAISGLQVGNWTSTGLAITGILGLASGTTAAPSMYFTSETNTGFYRAGAGQIGISIAGSSIGNFASGGFTCFQAIAAQTSLSTGNTGTAGAPVIYMAGDNTTGIYRPAANQVGITCSGAQVANFTSTGLAVTGKTTTTTMQVGGTGTTFATGIAFGNITVTTPNIPAQTATTVAFTHNLGVVPSSISVTVYSTGAFGAACNFVVASVSSLTTTGGTINLANANTSTTTSGSFNVSFIVCA